MSQTLNLKDEITAICAKAGLSLGSVARIVIEPNHISFLVSVDPMAEELEQNWVLHPLTWKAEAAPRPTPAAMPKKRGDGS
jgi:hypothetical protein